MPERDGIYDEPPIWVEESLAREVRPRSAPGTRVAKVPASRPGGVDRVMVFVRVGGPEPWRDGFDVLDHETFAFDGDDAA